jgi:ferredoxin-NADP reductase/Na+-transporting NADH:ubiquinone oxidoreductase subunit NqrB
MTFIDGLLNKITMYRLVLYYLIALLAIAAIFGAMHIMPQDPVSLIASTLILVAACWLANRVIAKIFRAPTNYESAYITALILALIISPVSIRPFDAGGFWFLIAASVFAMASKYIFAINRKHIFNPAAFAVIVTGFVMGQYASWWIGGNLPMLAFVLAGGLLVVRKIQRFDLVIAFFVAGLGSIILTNPGFDPLMTAEKALIHTSLFFFAFIMLTEPLTTPPTRTLRIVYGAIVGALFSPAIHIGSIYSAPEIALCVGNIFSYAVSPKRKYRLTLREKKEVGTDTYDFAFATGGKKISFTPGQYMEWTIDQHLPPAPPASAMEAASAITKDRAAKTGWDDRGNRRYFTIASSPTEPDLRLGVKFYGDPLTGKGMSTFKQRLRNLRPGDTIMGGSLAGDFTLPNDPKGKFVFIAGGIGVTPFRSMVKYLSDTGDRRDIIMLYANRTAAEIAYRDVFDDAARTIGLKTFYYNTDTNGRIAAATIMRDVPDYQERTFYISGPRGMVTDFKRTLHELGIPRTRIKTDFFPGFA